MDDWPALEYEARTSGARRPIEELVTIEEVRARAREILSPELADYISGGASGEQTLRANYTAFDQWMFQPRMLDGADRLDLSAEVFGKPVAAPVFTAPFGYDRAVHPEGHKAVARACAELAVAQVVPEASGDPLEQLVASTPQFLQLRLIGPDSHVLGLAERAADAGYAGLMFLDSPAQAWRERARRARLRLPERCGYGNYGPGLADLGVLEQLHGPDQPRWTFERLEKFAKRSPLPWTLKGVLTPDHARRAVDAGASGIYVSNLGGRDLDGLPSSLDCLPGVVKAVDGRAPVWFDSGVRRGTDVVKALALGADMVGIGRLAVLGLAAAGALGVKRVLELLLAEVVVVLEHLGCSSIVDLCADHLIKLSR